MGGSRGPRGLRGVGGVGGGGRQTGPNAKMSTALLCARVEERRGGTG